MLFFVRQNQVSHLPPPREVDRFSKLEWQGSSVVEQRTHKPFVGSSILPPATIPDLFNFGSTQIPPFAQFCLNIQGRCPRY